MCLVRCPIAGSRAGVFLFNRPACLPATFSLLLFHVVLFFAWFAFCSLTGINFERVQMELRPRPRARPHAEAAARLLTCSAAQLHPCPWACANQKPTEAAIIMMPTATAAAAAPFETMCHKIFKQFAFNYINYA